MKFPRLPTAQLVIAAVVLVGAPLASGQGVVLYQQGFAYGGTTNAPNLPISTVGWANDIPNNPNPYRLYLTSVGGGDGAVYAYQNSPLTTAFYTSTSLSGTGGAAFPAINPALHPGLTLSVDIQPGYMPANVSARFAVQMDGGNWFAAANTLPVPATVGPFLTYSNIFNPNAASWDSLSVSGNGTSSSAAIGGPASSDLTGNITGAGLVFVHTGAGGTYNFDNFKVTAANVGGIAVSAVANGAIRLSWNGALNVRLQCATNLAGPWTNIPGTGGQAATTAPVNGAAMFYRAAAFPLGGLQDGDFESGNLSGSWQVAGTIATASAAAGGAFSDNYFLLQSNSRPYQVQTIQLVTNLANGFYKLTAMVQNGGGQNYCYISGNDRMTSLPVSASWTPTVVRGINVTNGQCLVGIQSSDGTGGEWCKVDMIQLNKDDEPYQLLKGGDISELTYVEQGGGVFYETNGVPMDCLDILTNHGCNIVRLRLYNDPGNPNYYPSNLLPPGIQSPTNILALAARAKAKGLKIELTFYYSDGWANQIPHDWTNLTFSQLTGAVFSFTTNFMTEMKNQGTTPEYVSLGNEINNGGILTPAGSTGNWPQLAQLLTSGYTGVKAASPSTQVILHMANVSTGAVTGFLTQAVAYGVPWDITGCSYYPFWTGYTAEQARDQINAWYLTYNKPVLIMETGYNWNTNTCAGVPGQLSNNGPETFPSTPLGQKEFMQNCFNAIKLVNNGYCIGDLYWDPAFICVPGEGWELGQPNVVDNTTLFDFTGHALPVLDAFDFNN
jgi:arabinogalactan endo-1,4-beta-galactosidase